jgi:hypothetical protein
MLRLLVTALFLGQCHLHQCRSALGGLVATLLIGLIGQRFLPCGRRLLLPFFRHYCARTTFLLVLQAGKSGITLLPPCSHSGKADLEAVAVKPKEDGCWDRRRLCLGSAFIKKALVTSGFLMFVRSTLVEETLDGMLVEKLLATSSLQFLSELGLTYQPFGTRDMGVTRCSSPGHK